MAKTTKKKSSAKRPAASKARPARKAPVKRPALKKVSRTAKTAKRGPSKSRKETTESPALLLGMNHREKRLDPFVRQQKEKLLGSDAYDRDFALSLLSQEQDALYEIDQALKRIELGTYGKCEMSGKQIPRARLEAIPFARFTVECQSQLEKQNKASRVRQSVTSLFGLTEDEGGEAEEEEVAPAEVKE